MVPKEYGSITIAESHPIERCINIPKTLLSLSTEEIIRKVINSTTSTGLWGLQKYES